MKAIKYMLTGGNLFLFISGEWLICRHTEEMTARILLSAVLTGFCLMNLGSYFYFRSQFVALSSQIGRYSEDIMQGRPVSKIMNKETLTSKIVMELEKLDRITGVQISKSKKEKKELQEMISEITHQIKTPLSNIKMYCEMYTDMENCAEQSGQFMDVMKQQLLKVEFLLDALVKASRLEIEMIRLEPSNSRVTETLADAVNRVVRKAEQKQIEITVDCRSSIQVCHDRKWTAEAVENILDNAVKYTPEHGKINISIHLGEMYTEIKIEDTGKGIEASQINHIFKRFYREKSVSGVEGIGLGLYLARKIITMQKGYIAVCSAVGKGSCFSICLPNFYTDGNDSMPDIRQ